MLSISDVLKSYDLSKITIGVLGGHSALEVCEGAKKMGFKTVVVAQEDRKKTYEQYYLTRQAGQGASGEQKGCIDKVITVKKFKDITGKDIEGKDVQEQLRALNTIFIHNRYFWVYCDWEAIANDFNVPIYGTRQLVRLEERDVENNQYFLLEKAGIRIPKIIRTGDSTVVGEALDKVLDDHFVLNKGGPVIVKVNEATRTYERAFFVAVSGPDFDKKAKDMLAEGKISQEGLDKAVIEEFIIGAQVNLNFFYSPITGELELMGTDMRRQTSLDGFLRLNADVQNQLLAGGYQPSMVETGHVSVTMKESLLEKAFDSGEKFVKATQEYAKPGIIGPFALQGAVAAENGREEFVIFDVSMRIPGSPGTRFTPYTSYLWGRPMSFGERIAIDVKEAIDSGRLGEIVT